MNDTQGSAEPDNNGSVHVMTSGDQLRLVLAGEIDVALSSELAEAVNEATASNGNIEVDARHVTFMDSSGVAQLARLAHHANPPLTVIKPPEVMRFLLDVTKLGGVVNVVEEDPGFPGSPSPDPGGPAA